MKLIFMYIVAAAVMLAIVVGVMFAVRQVSNIATPITLSSPKAGITCASMVTGDGAAISCWKD